MTVGAVNGSSVWQPGWRRQRRATDPPRHRNGSVDWGALLTPHFVDDTVDLPGDTLQVYVARHWTEPDPAAIVVSAAPMWLSVRNGTGELALQIEARGDGDERESTARAGALLVARAGVPDGSLDFGTRALPRCPEPSDSAPDAARLEATTLIADEAVRTFAARSRTLHPLHSDPDAARAAGYTGLLVQGILLMDLVVATAGMRGGRVETWFRKPVVTGARLALWRADDVWWVVDDSDAVAAVARVSAT